VTQGLLQHYPNLKGIISPTTVGHPGPPPRWSPSSKYKGKVIVTGLGTPGLDEESTWPNGVAPAFELWNPADLGYLAAVRPAVQLRLPRRSPTPPGSPSPRASFGKFTCGSGEQHPAGPRRSCSNKANINNFNF